MTTTTTIVSTSPAATAISSHDPRVRRTRAAALATARALLDEGGWDAVTHVAVAQRSGIGRTTLYRHWPTADLLLREVIMESCVRVAEHDSGDIRDDLFFYINTFRQRLADPTAERSIAAAIERATVNPIFSRVRAAITAEYTAPIVAALNRAIADGVLRATTDVGVAVGELAGPVAFRQLFERKKVPASFVRQVVDDFLAAHAPAPTQ